MHTYDIHKLLMVGLVRYHQQVCAVSLFLATLFCFLRIFLYSFCILPGRSKPQHKHSILNQVSYGTQIEYKNNK